MACALLSAPAHAWVMGTTDGASFGSRMDEAGVGAIGGPALLAPGGSCPLASGSAADFHRSLVRSFCDDPYRYVCGTENRVASSIETRLQERIDQITTGLYEELAARHTFSPVNAAGWAQYLKSLGEDARAEASAHQAEAVMARTRAVLGGEAMQESLADFTDQVRRELDGILSTQPGISDASRSWMRSRLAAARFVTVDEVLARPADGPNRDPVRRGYARFCGPDGLNNNAFFMVDELVLCPGFLIAVTRRPGESGTGPTIDERRELFMTVAHELSHSCDFDAARTPVGPNGRPVRTRERMERGRIPEYYAYGSCLTAREGWTNTESRLPEIVADSWAAEALARRVERNPSEALSIIWRSGQYFCGDEEGSDAYPNAQFRVGTLIGQNPRIRQALGCEPAAPPPCQIGGSTAP